MGHQVAGRFALVEPSSKDQIVVLVFETAINVTGEHLAVLGIYGVERLDKIPPGGQVPAAFDARSLLTFDEDVAARRNSRSRVLVGAYRGEGRLEDTSNCLFVFTTSIVPGQWRLAYPVGGHRRLAIFEKQESFTLARVG